MVNGPFLPPYVSRGGEQVALPPYRAEKVRFYGFVLEANELKLQDMLDRYLNDPSGSVLQFVSATRFVLLYFADLTELTSDESSTYPLGFAAEREAALVLFASNLADPRLVAFSPYLFVNLGTAVAAGREAYGFPKQYASVVMPQPSDPLDVLSVEASAIARFSTGELATPQEVIQVQWRGGSDAAPGPPSVSGPESPPAWTTFSAARQGIVERMLDPRRIAAGFADDVGGYSAGLPWEPRIRMRPRPSLGPGAGSDVRIRAAAPEGAVDDTRGFILLGLNIVPSLLDGDVSLVSLKQFRDLEDPSRACYQAVTESRATLTGFHGGGLLPDAYGVSFADYDTQPIRFEFGFDDRELTPILSFWLDFDFDLGTGTELWRA